ncbi:MAG TPA: DUF11 domain-containing protein, partial [Thermoanaerobaculia bacterium]
NNIVTCVVGPVATTTGSHTNTAHATGTFNAMPVNSPDSSATYATTSLTLAKSVAESTFTAPGDLLHYSYLVTNNGFAPLAGPVTVSDNKATVTCPAVSTVGDGDNFLDPGESITCTAVYTVTATDVANAAVTNTASATVDGVTSNSDSKTVPLSTSADVSLVKTLSTAGPFSPGQSISYTIVVANAGPSTATNVQVTDTPTNLTITAVSGSGCSLPLPCTIPSLAAGANTTINVTATITAAGAFDNSATATAVEFDPNTNNNTDSTGNGGTAGATPSVDLAITKTASSAVAEVGGTFDYTLVVDNNGPGTATGVVVTDPLPASFSLLSATPTQGSCSGTTTVTCYLGTMANGATVTSAIHGTVNSAGSLTNTATVSSNETDSVPANNSSTATANGAPAIPALDGLGLLLLALVLAIAGAVLVRRRARFEDAG